MAFQDRKQAGLELAKALERYHHQDLVVLGLPRGGVMPAAEVARYLRAPLDVVVARKISHPYSPEFAVGAVAESGEAVWDSAAADARDALRAARIQHRANVLRRKDTAGREPLALDGKTAIIVDDGIATGLTMEAAVGEAWRRGAAAVVVAAPVAPESASEKLFAVASDVVVLVEAGPEFQAVSQYYFNFEQVTDDEVRELLQEYYEFTSPPALIDLESLNAVLSTIPDYPVTSGAIAQKAKALHAPASVVRFFESIPGGTSFQDKKDVMNRTYEVEVLAEQEQEEPDDNVRNY